MDETISATPLQRVMVEPRTDGHTDVWLRDGIVHDVADNGPDGPETEFWRANEAHLVLPGSVSEDEAEARFDELWARASREQMDVLGRIEANEATMSDIALAVAELGTLLGGD